MTNRRNHRITTYKQAFEEVLGIEFDEKLKKFVSELEGDGHTEKSIAFSIWRTKDTLLNHIKEDYFLRMLKNEILKYSWSKDDTRWKEYSKAKNIEEKINEFVNNSEMLGFMYFIQGENGGSIRIGYTVNPIFTLKALQKGYPDKLKILLVIPESCEKAIQLQNKFEHLKLKGGWYKPDKEIFDEIEKLKSKYPHVVGD